MTNRFWLFGTALLLAGLTGCATSPAPKTVTDTAAAAPQLSTLNRLIEEAGLLSTLRSGGPYTLFAPSDEAFQGLPASELQALASDRERLKAVLSYHVLPVKARSSEMAAGEIPTVHGAPLAISRAGSFVTIDEAMVTQADLPAGNGVVHVIDRVLMPPKPKK